MSDNQRAELPPFSDDSEEVFYGALKSFNRGFGWISCPDTQARYGRDVYVSKEEAAALANDMAVGEKFVGEMPLEGQHVKFQVEQSSEGYPQALHSRRVRKLRGEVLQLPGELAADGILLVKSGESGDVQALLGKEVRIRQSDCGQLRLHVGDDVLFFCSLVGDNPPMLEGKVSELRSTTRSNATLMGCFSMELPRAKETAHIRGHALPDRIVLAGVPDNMLGAEIMRVFSEFNAKDCIVTHEDAHCDAAGFASVSFPGGSRDVAAVLLRKFITNVVENTAKVARISVGARGHEEFGKTAPLLPALPRPNVTSEENHALMVRWSQVSLAAGYLVELRPVPSNPADTAGWSSVDVAAGQLERGSKLPPGLLGPQCSACRVNKLRQVNYEARISYFTACGCRSQSSMVSACQVMGTSPKQSKPAPVPDGPDWRAPSGNLIPSPPAPELIPLFEDGTRGILVQWPTVVHATAYVVELYEENSGTLERFHREVPENLREVLVELRVGNLQPSGAYSACVRAVAPCHSESKPSEWTLAPPYYPPYLPPAGPAWSQPPPLLHTNGPRNPPLGPSPLLSTNPSPPEPAADLWPPEDETEAQALELGGTAMEAAALVLD